MKRKHESLARSRGKEQQVLLISRRGDNLRYECCKRRLKAGQNLLVNEIARFSVNLVAMKYEIPIARFPAINPLEARPVSYVIIKNVGVNARYIEGA